MKWIEFPDEGRIINAQFVTEIVKGAENKTYKRPWRIVFIFDKGADDSFYCAEFQSEAARDHAWSCLIDFFRNEFPYLIIKTKF